MKKLFLLPLFFLVVININSFSQEKIKDSYQQQPTKKNKSNSVFKNISKVPGGYIIPDSSYSTAFTPTGDSLSNSDELSSGPIFLPFSICFNKTNFNTLWINTNGNITFWSEFAYNSYPPSINSSQPFPLEGYLTNMFMIAPFWADVDTEVNPPALPGSSGTIKYKVTPTAIYINWDKVGYYSKENDLVNSFQLIITDGTDPILPPGNNIGFSYGDMQWTTGEGSLGVDGFGGNPATVGINYGDGIGFQQIGRFDQSGTAYDGADGAFDGVDYLDNSSIYFDVCDKLIDPLIIPNVFTPNGDNTNDFLAFKNLDKYPESSLTIFNRWGNKIYDNSNYQNDWDGEGNSDGVYYFILNNSDLEKPIRNYFEIVR